MAKSTRVTVKIHLPDVLGFLPWPSQYLFYGVPPCTPIGDTSARHVNNRVKHLISLLTIIDIYTSKRVQQQI